jgi:hypothetical protein
MRVSPVTALHSPAGLAAILVSATAAIGGIVSIALQEQARHWLGFGFTGVSPTAAVAVSLFASNFRLLAAAGLSAAVAQARLGVFGRNTPALDPRMLTWLSWFCVCALAASVALNTGLVGLAVGAYGWRMVVAMLPHGPLELASYSIALSFFARARQEPQTTTDWVRAATTSVALLALAALLETFAWFG